MRLRGIEKRFGATVALAGVDLDITQGEVHALIGENGAGKSTLLNIIAGLMKADAGEIVGRAPQVAYIHQELSLCPHLSVAENILLGREPSRRGWLLRDAMHDRARQLLGELGRAEIDPRTCTAALSLADQQIVEICRALATDAQLILMDEPTSSLQRADVERLFALIRRLRERGIAIVYVSHFLEEVREIADRFTVLRDGRSIASGALGEVTDGELIAAMVGRDSVALAAGRPSSVGKRERPASGQRDEDSEIALRVATPQATFTLHRGEILGIAGLIGSGRTRLIRAIANRQTGYLSEDRKGEGLALQLSIADNVTLCRFPSRFGWIDLDAQAAQTATLMERLRIKAAGPHVRTFALSGGNQQKVALARLLHQDADVLLLDEPGRGIDVGSKSDIYREIAALAAAGKAIVIVSSYLPELFAICDRIAVMHRGRLGAARPTSEWTADAIMQEAIGAA